MSSGLNSKIINATSCKQTIENLLDSGEYLKICLERSGLSEVKSNADLSKLICAALGISIRKENVSKIRNTYIASKVCIF